MSTGGPSGSGFDWGGLMRAGLRDLRLAPAAFWALTPYEILMMLGLDGGGPRMARARLEELSRAYPDAGPGTRSSTQTETERARDQQF